VIPLRDIIAPANIRYTETLGAIASKTFENMKITFTYASQKDFKWLSDAEKGHEITSTMLKRKIQDKEVLLVKADNKLIGWLRFGFFWDEVPFMNMLGLDKEHRGKGIGKKLVRFWEAEMKKKKYKMVMTSSQSNEDAQHFYRKIGYADVGSLTLPKEPLEVIFIKKI